MAHRPPRPSLDYRSVELDGLRYVILRESLFEYLCEQAGLSPARTSADAASEAALDAEWNLDRGSLAAKLVRRRQAAGLSQAELARQAGVRPETLNRIERGRTTPDFATIRKLVLAMNAAERARLLRPQSPSSTEDSAHVRPARSK